MNIGIDLGGSHIAIGVVDNNGIIIEQIQRRILEEEKKNIIEFIQKYIVENTKKLKEKYNINSIGIAIPGTLNKEEIIKSVNLGIENYNIVKALQKYIKLPIKIVKE